MASLSDVRAVLRKRVLIKWRDPCAHDFEGRYEDLPKGAGGLSVWEEEGVLDDLTDGVARLIHSRCEKGQPTANCRYLTSLIPVDLIYEIQVGTFEIAWKEKE